VAYIFNSIIQFAASFSSKTGILPVLTIV